MIKTRIRILSIFMTLAIFLSAFSIVCGAEENKQDNNALLGIWETDFVFPASDLGVDGKDIVFRCELTFKGNGTVTSQWTAVELSSIKIYFHQMFVNAYYACGFGAGYTSIEEIEQICVASTGKSVAGYVFEFLDSFDMETIFCPADDEGNYVHKNIDSELYIDITLMGLDSDPSVANRYVRNGNKLEITADSFGQPKQVIHCELKKVLEEPTLPDNHPSDPNPPVTDPTVTVEPSTTEPPITDTPSTGVPEESPSINNGEIDEGDGEANDTPIL